jgi:predicted ATPase with chaperone activity
VEHRASCAEPQNGFGRSRASLLSHPGVLFLDELPEFSQPALDQAR